MVFRILLFVTRKPSLSPAEFKTYWETKHVPLVKEVSGEHFPLTSTRHYIARTNTDGSNSWPATVLFGNPDEFSYDGIGELAFTDEAAFQTFFALISKPEVAARIAADEEMFIVRDKLRAVVLGETLVTSKD